MLSVIFGLVGVIIGILWIATWGAAEHFLVVLQGSIPPFLILVGAVAVAAGISSMKDNMAAKKEQDKAVEDKPAEEAPAETEASPSEEEEEEKEEI